MVTNSRSNMGILLHASSKQAHAHSRPQVSWTCLSFVMLECTSPAERFSLKTVDERKFLSVTKDLYFNQGPSF